MTLKDPKTGKFISAERTTTDTRTRTVTERFTIHGDTDTLGAIPGWGNGPDLLEQRHHHHAHLGTQVAACEDFLWKAVVSGEMTAAQTGSWDTFAHELPELIRRAVVILTSGPEATPLELTDGRSV